MEGTWNSQPADAIVSALDASGSVILVLAGVVFTSSMPCEVVLKARSPVLVKELR